MKNSIKRIALLAIMALMVGVAAQAQFRFGVKAGIAANSLHLDKSTFESGNRCGFTGGVMAEFTVPIIGIGADVSLLYQHRESSLSETVDGIKDSKKLRGDFIDIPLNLKYKLSLPAVSQFVAPFITTGPDFSFRMSKENLQNAINDKKFDLAWNVGLGVEVVRHLQIAASYGIGITNHSSNKGEALYNSKNRCWTVTAAFLF